MKQALQDSSLDEKKLIPDFAVGCRRLTPSTNYLEVCSLSRKLCARYTNITKSLQKNNVTVVYGGVTEFTANGCKSGDTEYPLDIIICATGFDTSYKPRFPIIGRAGVNLQDAWADEPHCYLGIAASGFPNMFLFVGPHSPIGNGPVLSAIGMHSPNPPLRSTLLVPQLTFPPQETQADHMLQLVDRYQTENIASFAPKPEAVDDFMAHTRAFMPRTVVSNFPE